MLPNCLLLFNLASGHLLYCTWQALEGMSDVTICPIKSCQAPVIEDTKDCFGLCSGCKHSFCTLCREPYHPGRQCMTPAQKIALMQAKMKNSKAGEKALEEIKRMTQEAEDVHFVRTSSKQCPNCQMAIEKSSGCNKMRCDSTSLLSLCEVTSD